VTLPNFFVIGAARSGTTSLHDYLGQHPEVYTSAVKEPSFFAHPEGVPPRFVGPVPPIAASEVVTDRAAYERLFDGARGRRAIGESSPRYFFDDLARERIRREIPHARIVALVRDPVERTYAEYLGRRRDGFEPCASFEAALADEDRRLANGWSFGCHTRSSWQHRHLARWYAAFPAEQIRVHLFDDFRADPLAVVRDLYAFLGVDSSFAPDVSQRLGATGLIRNRFGRALWHRYQPLRAALRPFLPAALRDWALRRLTGDLAKPPLSPATHAGLAGRFREDVACLGRLLGRDLSHWLRTPTR
jgi:hypothetical protein